jgi:hypothetical protein
MTAPAISPVAALDDAATVRLALGACAKTLAGKPAAGSTQRRKRLGTLPARRVGQRRRVPRSSRP